MVFLSSCETFQGRVPHVFHPHLGARNSVPPFAAEKTPPWPGRESHGEDPDEESSMGNWLVGGYP